MDKIIFDKKKNIEIENNLEYHSKKLNNFFKVKWLGITSIMLFFAWSIFKMSFMLVPPLTVYIIILSLIFSYNINIKLPNKSIFKMFNFVTGSKFLTSFDFSNDKILEILKSPENQVVFNEFFEKTILCFKRPSERERFIFVLKKYQEALYQNNDDKIGVLFSILLKKANKYEYEIAQKLNINLENLKAKKDMLSSFIEEKELEKGVVPYRKTRDWKKLLED